MLLTPHRPNYPGEGGEVTMLDPQMIVLEERDHQFIQLPEVMDCIGEDPAVRALRADHSASEEAGQLLEHRSMVFVLVHLEGSCKLPPGGTTNERVAVNADREATLSVDEAHNPRRIDLTPRQGSFLLIVPTCHIVTAHISDPIERV